MDIFGFIGSIFGYLLWFLYNIFNNFGIAIIIFTVILKVIMFPFTLKQQRNMAGQARMTKKQNELKEKYGNNKTKYNEELQNLYQKEGFNPASGCLNSILPMIIMLGIYGAVISPITNTLHIDSSKVTEATSVIQEELGTISYPELEIVRNWSEYKDTLTMFTYEDMEKIEKFSTGFTFAGLDLLQFPSESDFFEFLWLIPLLSLLSSWFMSFYMSKTSGSAQSQQGCMKGMMFVMPLLSAWWAYTFPAAVGFYWISNQVVSAGQYYIINKNFSANHMTANAEASRFVTLQLQEEGFKPLSLTAQKQIADRIDASKNINENAQNQNQNGKNAKKKNNKSNKSNNDYMGNKK
ncbi:MAG: YidC/Oxa1 family membrane protein insertase [Clostridia bacterium]